MRLGDTLKADSRWRVFLFADRAAPDNPKSRAAALCKALAAPRGLLRTVTLPTSDIDAVIDVRAVFQQPHREVDLESLPALLLPPKGRFGLKDYEKAFCPDLKSGPDIFDLRGIDRNAGCVVVVRPDQYIATVLPLDAAEALTAYFGRILLPVV